MESNKKFNNSDKSEKDKDTKPTSSSSTSVSSASSSKSEPKQQPLEETAALESYEKQTKKSPDTSWFSESDSEDEEIISNPDSSSDSEKDRLLEYNEEKFSPEAYSESRPDDEEFSEEETENSTPHSGIRRYLDTIEEESESQPEAEVEDSDLYGVSSDSDSGSDKGKARDTDEESSTEDSSSDKGKEKDEEVNYSGYTGGSECRRDSDNESLSTIAGIEHDISDCKEEMNAIRKLLNRNYATKIKSSDTYEKTRDMNEEQQLDYINKHGNTLKKEYPDKYDDNQNISDNAQSIRDTATERERELYKIMNEKIDEHNDMYMMRGNLLFGEGILRRAPRVSTSNEEDSNESAGASGSGSDSEPRSGSDSDSSPESDSGPDENSGGSISVGEDTDNPSSNSDDIDPSSPEEEPSTENDRNNLSFKEHFIFYTSYTVSLLGDIIDSMFNHFFF